MVMNGPPAFGGIQAGSSKFLLETTSHLIYASVELSSSRDRASRESSLRIARNGLPACESSVARQTVFRFSNVGDTVARRLISCVLFLPLLRCGEISSIP